MIYKQTYDSPIGTLFLAADDTGLAGLWREEYCQYLPDFSGEEVTEGTTPVLEETAEWLDAYFEEKVMEPPAFSLAPRSSAFRREVWEIIKDVPYGSLMTYGEIARILAERRGIPKMAAQAVGGAVGHNPISIIIPCHRIVGTGGNLTGYGGSMWVKKWLLAHEGVDLTGFYDPQEKNGSRL